MKRLLSWSSGIALMFFSCSAQAVSPTFDQVTKSDLRKIAKDFGAVFVHTSVSPASSLGDLFGFELGFVVGNTQTPEIEDLIAQANPDAEVVSTIPHAALLGVMTVSSGLTVELAFLPTQKVEDVKLKYQSLALKWTMTDSWIKSKADMALKLHYSQAGFFYKQDVNSVETNVEISEQVMGLTYILSRKMVILEPYVGVGYVMGEGTATLTGSTEEFFTFTASQSASAQEADGQYFLGLNINLMGSRFGFEAGQVFDAMRVSVKWSAYF